MPVLGVELVESLLERVQLHLEGADLVGELPVVPAQPLVVHLAAVEVVGQAHNLVGARLVLLEEPFIYHVHMFGVSF